jgi:F0F1-type ATP synthase membrane subunit b/b'
MIAAQISALGIDSTLGIQFVVFVIFYAWLRWVFFPPFLNLLEAREAKTSGLIEKSQELLKEAEIKEAELAAKTGEVRRLAAAEKDKLVGEAKAKSHTQIEVARKEAKKKIEDARAQADGTLAGDLASLRQQANQLSDLFVEKLTKERAHS